jgi:hypothetical protein
MSSPEETTNEVKSLVFAPFHGHRRRAIKNALHPEESTDKHGYIYLLRTREFRLLGRPIYKIGKTIQEPDTRIRRLTEYTKGSEVFCVEQCNPVDVSHIELEILAQMRTKYGPGPEGSEYFELPTQKDVCIVRNIIHNVVIAHEERRAEWIQGGMDKDVRQIGR